MIFNPFDIHTLQQAIQQAAPTPWATPLMQDNIYLVLLILLFVLVDLLACHPKGVLLHQLAWLGDTRNARTFESTAVIYPWLRPMLQLQFFVFMGLCILSIADPQMARHLATPDAASLRLSAICMTLPVAWYALQGLLVRWFCYLLCLTDQQAIMHRIDRAIQSILAPASTLIFIGVLAGSFTAQTTSILLAALFILSQIVFVFCGFKIFCTNFYSFCLIIVYLCTLQIAPLLVIFTKIAG